MAKTYEAMEKTAGTLRDNSRHLDLKSRKQIADIAKNILRYNHTDSSHKVFAFTSCRRHEGVTTIFANLAHYFKLQNANKKILLIDTNLQFPHLHKIFGVTNSLGLIDCLQDIDQLPEAVTPINLANIFILPAGNHSHQKTCDLNQENMSLLLETCRKDYDFIFLDSAPIISSVDGLSTAVTSDITFLIIQSLKVQQEVALKAKTLLEDNECIIGGVILNKVQQVIPGWMYRII